jgi:hypothetical protein
MRRLTAVIALYLLPVPATKESRTYHDILRKLRRTR